MSSFGDDEVNGFTTSRMEIPVHMQMFHYVIMGKKIQ